MPHVLDKKATKIARVRHERGVDYLQAIFGWEPVEAEERLTAKRAEQATGPTLDYLGKSRKGRTKGRPGQHPTRHHWSRKGRRQVTKAQRLARRKNR